MKDYSFPPSRRTPVALRDGATANGERFARLAATATAVPARVVSNDEIVAAHGHQVSAAAMAKLVGVAERHVAEPGVVDTDLLGMAAERCLARAGMRPEALSRLLVTKFVGDRLLPMTASLLQKKLGCSVAIQSYDIDGGIHSFMHALDAAACFVATGDGPTLIASGGVINRLISRKDARVAFQYGDGAAAVLLVPSNAPHLLSTCSFTNYEFADLALGFSLESALPEDIHQTRQYDALFELYQQRDWKPAREFVLDAMRRTVDSLLKDAGKRWSEVELFLVTETHYRLWLSIVEHLGIAKGKTVSLLARYGNTMSAMLPMQLDEAIRTRPLAADSLVMLLSIGEGLSGGGALVAL